MPASDHHMPMHTCAHVPVHMCAHVLMQTHTNPKTIKDKELKGK